MPIKQHNNYDENQLLKSTSEAISNPEWNNKQEIQHVKLDGTASAGDLATSDNQTNGNQKTQIVGANGAVVDVVSHEGDISQKVVVSHKEVFCVHISIDNVSGTTGYMLVDLSDTINWPHTETGHVVLDHIAVNTNASSSPAFLGDLIFGFLSDVNATNGTLNRIGILHGQRGNPIGSGVWDFSNFGLDLMASEWFGPKILTDTTWQTDVNLLGPDGNTSYPSGNGDFVMKLVSTAGTIDLGITLFYTTRP